MKMKEGMDPRVYWIWTQRAFGAGSPSLGSCFGVFPPAFVSFMRADASLWNRMELVSEREAGMLYSYGISQAQALLEYCYKCGQEVITPECEKISRGTEEYFLTPPAVLYLKGKLPDVDRIPTVAIVGARKAAEASVRAAEAFGYQLASGGRW